MDMIKVWCEYDISGEFAGNFEEAFILEEDISDEEVEKRVKDFVMRSTGLPEEEMQGLYGWEYINIRKLK